MKEKKYKIYFKFTNNKLNLSDFYIHECESLDLKKAIKIGRYFMSNFYFGYYVPQKYIKFIDIKEVKENF